MTEIDTPYKPLNYSKATVLITGGGSGIGLGLAEKFLQAGSKVVICGRRAEVLAQAKQKHSALTTFVGDIETAESRQAIFDWVKTNAPEVNVVLLNAGIQRRVNLSEETDDWTERQREIDINASAPVHLTHLFGKWLVAKKTDAAIIYVTSGLAYSPFAAGPVYGASKAFLHSFIWAARPYFYDSRVQIIEMAPPAVKTDLGGSHQMGMELDDFCNQAFAKLQSGQKEFGIGHAEDRRVGDRSSIQKAFEQILKVLPIKPF